MKTRHHCCFFGSLLIFLAACASSGPPVTENQTGGTILFVNKSSFTVHIVRGSGRIDVVTLAPSSSAEVPNEHGTVENYYPLFDIPITRTFSISKASPLERDNYFQIDNTKNYQEIEIAAPKGFNDNSAYILFTNNSKGGGVSLSRNEAAGYMTGINFPDGKFNVNEGETMLYRVNPQELQSLRINPINLVFGEIAYQPSFVYSFTFDGNEAFPIEARPLTAIGQNAPVALEFTGYQLSPQNRTIIANGLRDALQSWGTPLELSDNTGPGYLLTLFININQIPPAPPLNTTLLRAEAEIVFSCFGRMMAKSGRYSVTELNEAMVARFVSEQIQWDRAFFADVMEAIE